MADTGELETVGQWRDIYPRRRVRSLPVNSAAAGVVLTSLACIVYGYTLFNGATTTGGGSLNDGVSAAGQLIIPFAAAASAKDQLWMGEPGVYFETGVFLAVGGGSWAGSVWVHFPGDYYQ